MVSVRALGLAAAGVALAAFGGCAGPEPQRVLEPAAPAGDEARVWPAPPEVPRYAYVGELTGERNLRADPNEISRRARGLFAWIAGLGNEAEAELVLQRPQTGVTGSDGRIYVADVSHQAVLVFDEAAQRVHQWTLARPLERFSAPIAVALAGDEVLVTDADIGVVVRLDRDGTPVGTFGSDVLQRPTGLARDGRRRRLYVADTRAHDVKVFDDDGALLDVLGAPGPGPGQFNAPTHLAFANDHLYVTDTLNSRIQVFDSDGRPVDAFGERGLYVGNLARPKGVAVDDEGNIYVVESFYDHLLVYDAHGRFLLPIGGTGHGPGEFYLPSGVWIDARNRVYVADMFNGRISIFQFLGGG